MTDIHKVSPVHVIGISGSLRVASYNTALLRAATHCLPPGMTLEALDIGPLPMYNEDVRQVGLPEAVQQFRTRLAAADAILISTPEYNYSVPGVLKNALDWASRPPEPPLDGKPLAMMGASTGEFGTVRAQMHLRQICVFLNMLPINRPQVLIGKARERFDADLNLTDEASIGFLRDLLVSLANWTRRLRGETVT